jgi:DNA polymerase-1
MVKKLFLLDGMALVYRAHFALISRPIMTSKGVNTSALYGFTQTLLEIIKNQQPTHIAVAFDTDAPTHRHIEFAEYKATRQVMPEDLSLALPHVRRMIEAFRIPVLTCDGYEADDIIGTVVRRAEKAGFKSYMVTPDKDFGQLIDENTFLYKPSRMGDAVEVMGLPEIRNRWGVQRPEQVVDVLALMGDSSDNIPGVPGIGEKTASKLIGQFGSVEQLLARTQELTGRVKETMEKNRDLALLSKRLATIICDAPCAVDLEALKLQPPDEQKLKELLVEFEFNSIGRRLFGEEFKAGRGFRPASAELDLKGKAAPTVPNKPLEDLVLVGESDIEVVQEPPPPAANLKTINDVPHEYRTVTSSSQRADLVQQLSRQASFCFDTETTHLDPKQAQLVGLAFSFSPHTGYYVPLPQEKSEAQSILEEFRAVFESEKIEKVGHNLKFDLSVLKWHGLCVRGKLFDTMVAHSLLEPDMRHSLSFLSESFLGYTPVPITTLIGDSKDPQVSMDEVPLEKISEYAAEDADVALQLRAALEPLLKEKGQERVFYEVESPLIPVLVDMEYEGIKIDAATLADFAAQLAKEIDELERTICRLAGTTFNLNSPRQLGQILFDVLKICEAPKKTRTGQYATDEQTLAGLAPDHEIVQRLLDHRTASKLKSTYADTLPTAIWPGTQRVHTTFNQVATATGRLNSQDPNLQNIPIRTQRGQEIRKAFVPRNEEYLLLSADYSQIELRIIAAVSHEAGLLEAFRTGVDIHTATAARVYGIFPDLVTPEMRRKAKMVNFGIAYGISAFGLSQRLGIPRKEANEIIEQYFKQFPGIRGYMNDTIAFARKEGYVQTVTGRRRYIRDIRSSNNTVRSAAERNAINAPIQGTAADMIKVAMVHIHEELTCRQLRSRLLLQVHDELVFDLYAPEEKELRTLVEEKMKTAIPLEVPIAVEMGVGENWLEAH